MVGGLLVRFWSAIVQMNKIIHQLLSYCRAREFSGTESEKTNRIHSGI
jgi:hypothetical protein